MRTVETTTHHHVGMVQTSEQHRHLGGVVLAVGIELVCTVETLLSNVAKTETESPTDSQVEWKSEAGCSGSGRYLVGPIDGTVVYYHDLVIWDMSREVGEHLREGVGLIEGRDNGGGSHEGNGTARLS